MKPQTATQLFANIQPAGEETCFYCAGSCEAKNPASKIVKKSFTGLDTVTLSQWVCDGCLAAMDEKAAIELLDGVRREGQKTRGYSWVVANGKRIAATKAHREQLAKLCINPPMQPFVICITDSGQKHLLYRAFVNQDRKVITVTLEGEPITYRPSELIERIELCKQVCAATGKPAMKAAMDTQSLMRVMEYHEDENVLAAWLDCFSEPLTQLAVWLCPPKDDCVNEYPAVTPAAPERNAHHGPTQAAFSWAD